jgi:antirestriction protein ArdC
MSPEEASERIAATFGAGIAPWSRPNRLRCAWGLPVNAATAQPIRGVNTWLLEAAAIWHGYRTRFWGTVEQWRELGGVVRGEGTPVLADQDGSRTEGEHLLFSVEQVQVRRGVPANALDRFWIAPRLPDYNLAHRLVKNTGAQIVRGNGAYYHRVGHRDWVEMPPVSRYIFIDDYW